MLRVVRPSRLVVLFKLVYLSKQILLRREESDDRRGQGVGERRRAIGLVLVFVRLAAFGERCRRLRRWRRRIALVAAERKAALPVVVS